MAFTPLTIGSQKGVPTVNFVPYGTKKEEPDPSTLSIPEPIKNVLDVERGLATGVAKGGSQTLLGIGRIGNLIQKGLASGAKALGINVSPQAAGETSVFNPESKAGIEAKQKLEPENTSERIGKTLEQAAEYFIPAGAATKAEKTVAAASKLISSPFLSATTRVFGNSLAQAVPAAGVKLAQTSGDVDEALATGAFAGATRGAFQLIGEGAKALKLPEKLYTTVFKNTKKDMLDELRANGLEKIRVHEPELFSSLVKSGVVKNANSATPVINETLAEQALARGLQGSVDDMADEVVRGTLKSEAGVRNIARSYTGTVDLPEEQFVKVLDELAAEYDNVGFGDISTEASNLASKLKTSSGKVDANTALDIRRFFDRMRLAASFEKPITKLSTAEANLKTLADAVRERVNKVPGMGETMKDYSYYIDALDALAQAAKQSGNNQVLSLIDTIFLASAAGTGSVAPVVGGTLNKLLIKSAGGATRLGQALERGIAGPALGGTTAALSSGVGSVVDQ